MVRSLKASHLSGTLASDGKNRQGMAHKETIPDTKSPRHALPGLTLAALGIVFGDIGTSPLYTLREAFGETGGLHLEPDTILGVLSLIVWALIVVVALKYVCLIMRADNRGEGGVLALATLASRGLGEVFSPGSPRERLTVILAMCGAALFYGDGVITPAISVLSAVEGLHVVTPRVDRFVVPIAITILIGLFVAQRVGTGKVGRLFGPIICVWFTVLGGLGIASILETPSVLWALSPGYAISFFQTYQWQSFLALGAVVLAVTGAEALYADMGHFGRIPIRLAWFGLVLPGLILNYFGQGALLLRQPEALRNPFYLLAPEWALLPLVILATCATVIASQAVISGAFSLTRQAVRLGYLPRMLIQHTSESEAGQVYVPRINWLLMVLVVVTVLGFGSSANMAAAYGIAVTGGMMLDSILACFVAWTLWGWNRAFAVVVFALLLVVDLAFFAANSLKIPAGGWFPLLLAGLILAILSTWRMGRAALFNRLHANAIPLEEFVTSLSERGFSRIPGTAVFLSGRKGMVPRALLHNLKHNRVLHGRNIIVTVETAEIPRVPLEERFRVQDLGHNVYQMEIFSGFMEVPHVPQALLAARLIEEDHGMMDTSFFLSRENLIASPEPDLSRWRERLFIVLQDTSLPATEFFGLPPDRVVEMGTQLRI